MAAELAERVAGCDFGRTLHRLDITVTSLAGSSAEHARTQHVTFRPAPGGGLVEDPLYRNLHPMLAERIELWRLANFALERLLSPEDIFLFRAVAHSNPKDVRLFAMAEVRDLTPALGSAGEIVGYPALERVGLQALAAMRRRAGRAARPGPSTGEPDRAERAAAVGGAAPAVARAGPPLGSAGRRSRPAEGGAPGAAGRRRRRGRRRSAAGRRPARRRPRRGGRGGPGVATRRAADPAADRLPAAGAARPAHRGAVPVRGGQDAGARRRGRPPPCPRAGSSSTTWTRPATWSRSTGRTGRTPPTSWWGWSPTRPRRCPRG